MPIDHAWVGLAYDGLPQNQHHLSQVSYSWLSVRKHEAESFPDPSRKSLDVQQLGES